VGVNGCATVIFPKNPIAYIQSHFTGETAKGGRTVAESECAAQASCMKGFQSARPVDFAEAYRKGGNQRP